MCLNLGERSVNERVSERCPLYEPRVQSLLKRLAFHDPL